MRVQLTARCRPTRDESGAIALLAALLTTTLLVLAAFTVDFGIAYTSKQRLQEATDAGALAAAQVYKGQTGPCATLAADPDLRNAAQQAADKWALENRPSTVGGPIAVTCSPSGLTVSYSTSGTAPVGLGQLAGGGSEIALSRSADATIGRDSAAVGGLRPWGICSGAVTSSGTVVFVPMEGGSTTDQDSATVCGTGNPPGGWWVAQCTGQSNGQPASIDAVANGCATSDYTPVPSQPTDPAALLGYLKSYCPKKTENSTCLSSDTGNNFHNTSDAWQTLVGTTFTMPVFCGTPTCSALEYTAQGANATYAIQRVATVELCGFKLSPRDPSLYWPQTGPCATANPKHYTSSSVTDGAGFFVVIKGLTGGPGADWTLDEYTSLRLTK
ncbi:MAG TPA: pilus assembly protein TadG-related protein [Marmoricola sp.]|nr:pilus assembly protein TadG-related protein [Marmoricola sp.]